MGEIENATWYPPGEGWVEWHGGPNPAPGAIVDVLLRYEREDRSHGSSEEPSDCWDWGHTDESEDIVAYRVVTPAPSTVDRALFDEMVEALTDMEAYSSGGYDDGRSPPRRGDALRRARAVLAKAREAGK